MIKMIQSKNKLLEKIDGKFIPKNLKRENPLDDKTYDLYKRILSKAQIDNSDKHLERLKDLTLSDQEPKPRRARRYTRRKHHDRNRNGDSDKKSEYGKFMDRFCGKASKDAYKELVNSRNFDWFGRAVKTEHIRTKKFDTTASSTSSLLLKSSLSEIKEKIERERKKHLKKLTTPIWKIGYKDISHGPPGVVASQIKNSTEKQQHTEESPDKQQGKGQKSKVLNSEGNESIFSYDGEWENGNMDGKGVYNFVESNVVYSGSFKRNIPDGSYGKAIYGRRGHQIVYFGDWLNGSPHGEGRAIYHPTNIKEFHIESDNTVSHTKESKNDKDMQGTLIYEGQWKKGKRHGKGVLTYPNGSFFDGYWKNGLLHGTGKFVSPEQKKLNLHDDQIHVLLKEKSEAENEKGMLIYRGEFRRGHVYGYSTVQFPNGKIDKRDWTGTVPALTLHEAISLIEKEWEQETQKEYLLRQKLHSDIRRVKLLERMHNTRKDIHERRSMERKRVIMDRRESIRKARRDNNDS